MRFNIPEEHKKAAGVYIIRSRIDSKVYVGSTINFDKRYRSHKSDLILNKHENQILQNYANRHGVSVFTFDLLEVCELSKEALLGSEQYYLDFYGSVSPNGFNIAPKAGSCLGVVFIPPLIKTCPQCLSIFETRAGTKERTYCSNKCRAQAASAASKLVADFTILTTCPCCGNDFNTPKVRPNKFCSRTCYFKHKVAASDIKTNIRCQFCQKPFEALKREKNRRFCSSDCSAASLVNLAKQHPNRSRKVVQLSKEGYLIKVFDSQRAAAKLNGFTVKGVFEVCNNKKEFHKGYRFKFLEESPFLLIATESHF